jgi:tetratricopeptide (TPR) repeat protein
LAACGKAAEGERAATFASSLASIDKRLDSSDSRDIDKAFADAYDAAGNSTDWLGILKRAERAMDGRSATRRIEAAKRALKAFPRSLALHSAAAYEYLRAGKAREALGLFDAVMPPDARSELWAEAFLSSSSADAEAKPSDYARLAEATGDPKPLIGAAAASLASGDRLAASAWLQKAMAEGASPPSELLWDCGLYERLAARPDASLSADELELMGDAAWKSGDPDLAKRRWTRSIALGPKASWRPYADLALLSGGESEAAESYWSRLRAAFLADPASPDRDRALCAYAAHMARTGQSDEALKVLKGGGDSGAVAALKLEIGSASMPEERYAVELERLASAHPDDPEVMGIALRELSRRGMYGEVALMTEAAARRKLPLRYGWFYEATARAARGDYAAAIEILRSGAGGRADAEASFALGSLLAEKGDHAGAVKEFSSSAATARDGKDRCAALKSLGRELAASGDPAGAKQAYKRAKAADPSDAAAAMLARGSGK